jgi:hypothetical protein
MNQLKITQSSKVRNRLRKLEISKLINVEFQKWMDEVGIIAPRVKFPVQYGPMKLIGAACIEEISKVVYH